MIAWFTKNTVAANLLAIAIIAAGLYPVMKDSLPVEFFPSSDPDVISVTVPYRGSTPVEVEEAVVVRVEEEVQDLEGIRKITSSANEGSGTVRIEVDDGYDPRTILEDVKNRVGAINTFPVETENPRISLAQRTFAAITITLSGDIPEKSLRELGELVREEVLAIEGVTQVELTGIRPYEIGIEVRQEILEEYNLTFADISNAIQRSSLDLAAGSIKTDVSEILLRTKGQAYTGEDFENIVIKSDSQGSVLRIKDVAVVNDAFSEEPSYTTYDGKPAVFVAVSSVGKQNILTIAGKVKDYIEERKASLPSGVSIDYWRDQSRVVDARLSTLLSSAVSGGLLVFTILTLFLRPSLAIWVCFGIPISFLGAIAVMPWLDVTVNIISLFGFILVLGIVVDDAIVTGESIFTRLQQGMPPQEAAIQGTKDVAAPVTFGVLTTMVAFLPLFLMSAGRGPIWQQIPLIIIPVLAFSLVESKLILPAHLSHVKVGQDRTKMNAFLRAQRWIADGLQLIVKKYYQPFLRVCLKNRYITVSIFIFAALLMFGMFTGGKYLRFVFFPRVETEYPSISITMPLGTASEITEGHVLRFQEAAAELQEKYTDPDSGKQLIKAITTVVGATRAGRG
ncbi:MAG: efflux RND transporter permease subunit, partial [Verrucomicrobiota bacterium]